MVGISNLVSFFGKKCETKGAEFENKSQHSTLEKNVENGPSLKPQLDKDVFAASGNQKGRVLSKREKQIQLHKKQLQSETEGMRFKMIKLKFYPEDEAKMENMTVREKIAFIRRLKDEGRYTVLNPEVMDEK